ncbi:MAG: hypothetical protein ACFFAN_17405 [Promethearchaeota archaeon]
MAGLSPIDIANGLFSLIFVSISTIVGINIALKYLKSRQRTLLFVGFSWVLIASPWWPSSVSFLIAFFSGGQGLSIEAYLLLGNVLVPLFIILLVATFTDIYFHDKQKIILLVFAILGIFIEIYLVYYIFVLKEPEALGVLQGSVDIEFQGFLRYYLLFSILQVLVMGSLIALNSIRSDTPEIKLRGKFLFAAFIFWSIGAICDAAVPLSFITLTIIRLILISSAIEFYFGFILPDWIKNLLLKEK